MEKSEISENSDKLLLKDKTSIIGVIPSYPKHTKQNIFSNVMMPPIGIVSVLTHIMQDDKYSCYCVDENNYSGPLDYLGMPDHDFLQKHNPARFAFLYGGMSNSILRMFSLAKQYKRFGCHVISGGSHVDALPKEALSKGVDIVVHGEGEETAKEIVEAVIQGRPLEEIKGISFINQKGEYIFTGHRDPCEDMDVHKIPDLTLMKYLKKKFSAIPLSYGLGCPFRCEFCVVHSQYGKYKSFSKEKVIEQISRYSDMGFKEYFFTNDNFAQDKEKTIELCKAIGDYKRKFRKKLKIIVQVRNEVAEHDDLIEAMKYAGIDSLCIGYESPINEDLKAMNKGVNYDLLVRRSRKLAKNFYIHGMFIFGYPSRLSEGEKPSINLREKARRYEKFFKDAKIDSIQVFKAIPLPGSKLRERLEREKRLMPLEAVNWDKYDGLFLCYDPTPEGISAYELQNLPNLMMNRKYAGNFLERSSLNFFNWTKWVYRIFEFVPVFGIFYIKNLVRNIFNNIRKKNDEQESSLLPKKNIFYASLLSTWLRIKRNWRNTVIATYARGVAKRWRKEYNQNDYSRKFKDFFAQKQESK
ncbi:MAG: radical SAM protein [Candidatus Woesearchaeota archaeon]